MGNFVLFFLFSLFLEGVFGDMEVVSVKMGDSVTLHTDFQIQNGEVIFWRFQDKLIVTVVKNTKEIVKDEELDDKLKDRLKLDNQTGDLTITNIMTTDSGDYEVSNENGVKKTFKVSVVSVDFTKTVSVSSGDLVTLLTDVPDIKTYNAIQWRFEHQKSPVAEIKAGNIPKYGETDKRFKGKLQLDPETASLTITNIRAEQAGLYEVNIISSEHTTHKLYNVTVDDVMWSEILMKQGDSVLLQTSTKVQDNDLILWKFKDVVLAEMYKAEKRISTYDGPDERFKNRLKLDGQTGDLTIMKINPTDSGFYELIIWSNRRTVHKKFTVSVSLDAPLVPVCGPVGWSSGAVAGIVVGLLLLLVCVVAALVFYYGRKIADLQKHCTCNKGDHLMANTEK